MINIVYRLVAPKLLEEVYTDLDLEKGVIVRPTYLSICKADQRYYFGKRAPEVIEQKLPMALIHEAIGTVVKDNTGTYNVGDKVVMINGGARNVFNTKSDHNMKILQWTLLYCIRGQVADAAKLNKSDVKMTTKGGYYVFDIDVSKQAKGRWNHLEASYSTKDMSLCVLKLEEKNGNTTTYNTLEKEYNGVVTKDIFNY